MATIDDYQVGDLVKAKPLGSITGKVIRISRRATLRHSPILVEFNPDVAHAFGPDELVKVAPPPAFMGQPVKMPYP